LLRRNTPLPRRAVDYFCSGVLRVFRRGELAQLILLILTSVDLTTIPLLELTSDIRRLAQTTVELPLDLHRRLKKIAEARKTSMNAIVNSAVVEYTKQNQ
jgi:hypothetical protein